MIKRMNRYKLFNVNFVCLIIPLNMVGLEKLFAINSFVTIVLRKFMTWSIIAILFFSSLSFAITTQWSQGTQRETGPQAINVDADSSGLKEELELQDLTETAENKPQIPKETMESMILQNSIETAENKEPQLPTEFETPDFDSGKVRTSEVAIYWDSSINNPLSSIDWGNLEPGTNKNIECYIQNIGNIASILTLETANWNPPEAATYITLTWDYDGQTLNIDEVTQVTLILTISENIQGITSFFFDIIITGSDI
jgi:hypothetical protein